MINRKQNWQRLLVEYLADCSTQSFRPGILDCGLFFAGAVKAMTGVDPAKPLRGKYRSIKGAKRVLNEMGFRNHIDYVASLFEERSSILAAQRGDGAVVTDADGEQALGIVQGERIYVMGLNGIGLVPLTEAEKVFIV